MHKKFCLLLLYALHFAFLSRSQSVVNPPLRGVWLSKEMNLGVGYVFRDDSTMYFTTPNGIITRSLHYSIDYNYSPWRLNYLIQDPGEKPAEYKALIFPVNDSTVLIKYSSNTKRPDTTRSGKHIYTFHKLKEVNVSDFTRSATLQDIVGVWQITFKKQLQPEKFTFKADGTGVHQVGNDTLLYFHYKVDLDHRPRTIDFYYDAGKVVPAYFGFYNDTTMRMEGFPNGKRPDHWTVFGYNIRLIKQP
jgi:hypothetical protein